MRPQNFLFFGGLAMAAPLIVALTLSQEANQLERDLAAARDSIQPPSVCNVKVTSQHETPAGGLLVVLHIQDSEGGP